MLVFFAKKILLHMRNCEKRIDSLGRPKISSQKSNPSEVKKHIIIFYSLLSPCSVLRGIYDVKKNQKSTKSQKSVHKNWPFSKNNIVLIVELLCFERGLGCKKGEMEDYWSRNRPRLWSWPRVAAGPVRPKA